MRHALIPALALALITGPVAAQEVVAGHTIYKNAEPSIWSGQADKGDLKHLATGVVFPEAIGDYKRTRMAAIDNGNDVSAHYERAGGNPITVYLFKPGNLPEHRLKGAITSIGAFSAETFLWSDGPFAIDAPTRLKAFKGTYKTGIGPGTVMDYLYFVPLGSRTVKVRGTLSGPKDIAEELAIDAFVRTLPWAQIEAANGACSGPACRTGDATPFNSHVSEGMITRLLAVLKGKPDEAKVGSLEPLFTASEGGANWRVTRLDDKFADLFQKSFGGITATAPLYTLVREKDGKSEIVRFFAGTPTEAQFRTEVAGLVRTPETSPFIPPSQAAAYQAD